MKKEYLIGTGVAADQAIIALEGDARDCIFYGFDLNHPPFGLKNPKHIALCPINKIAEMAAENISLFGLLRAKFRYAFHRYLPFILEVK